MEKTFYELIDDAMSIIFPQVILDHAVFGFLIDLSIFVMSMAIAYILFFAWFHVGYRLIKKGLNKLV